MKPKPTDADFEALLCEVFIEHSQFDFVEGFCLTERAKAKVESRFSRRAIRKRDIPPAIYAALERMLASGRIKGFSVLGHRLFFYPAGEKGATVFALSYDREVILDLPNLDQ
jgi:hypothetical protein